MIKLKAINCYEKRIKACTTETTHPQKALPFLNQTNNSNNITNSNSDECSTSQVKPTETKPTSKAKRRHLAKLYLALGHFYLLIYDYLKALNSYQTFLTFKVNKLKVSKFFF